MLEILLVIFLCGKVGGIVKPKGYSSGWFKFFTVLGWFGGEFSAAFAAAVTFAIANPGREPPMLWLYLFALIGAAVGVAIVFWIAQGLPDKQPSESLPGAFAAATQFSIPPDTGNPYQPPGR